MTTSMKRLLSRIWLIVDVMLKYCTSVRPRSLEESVLIES